MLDVRGQLDFPFAEPVEKPTLYRQADVLSLHVDMRPGNENLVGQEQMALMKPTAVLINTSRGEVLDAGAMADAMRGGQLAGAALDVFAPEPPRADFPLLALPNILLTPHLAARTSTALENMSWVVRDVVEVLEGRAPKYPARNGACMKKRVQSSRTHRKQDEREQRLIFSGRCPKGRAVIRRTETGPSDSTR